MSDARRHGCQLTNLSISFLIRVFSLEHSSWLYGCELDGLLIGLSLKNVQAIRSQQTTSYNLCERLSDIMSQQTSHKFKVSEFEDNLLSLFLCNLSYERYFLALKKSLLVLINLQGQAKRLYLKFASKFYLLTLLYQQQFKNNVVVHQE